MAESKKALDFSETKKFHLLIDLHSNSKEFASAAQEAGADAVILHLNESPAQGARFGGLEIEEDSIKECLSDSKLPIGLTIGDARQLSNEEWEKCVGLGFSFANMFAHHMPTFVWKDDRISKLISFGPGYILEQIRTLSEFREFSAYIASFTPVQGIGLNLSVLDVTTLKLIVGLVKKPVLFPTLRMVRKEDVGILRSLGVRGIILNNVTYGNSVDALRETVQSFKEAIASSAPASKK
jgi:hypothetical protein